MLSSIVRYILSLRYTISVEGLEQLKDARGVLILPNHPAEIDPVILMTLLWDVLRPRPVVLESFFHAPALAPLMRFIRAIPMADMDYEAGPYKRRRVMKQLHDVTEALQRGDSVLIYPSGRLSVNGAEQIGGNSGAWMLLKECPDARVALVRIRGLYGSIFSKAQTGGATPRLRDALRAGALTLIKNFIFFAPRREVQIEIALDPEGLPRSSTPLALNRYLEEGYNYPTPEAPSLVSYSCFREQIPTLPERPSAAAALAQIPAELTTRVCAHVAHIAEVDAASLTFDTKLGDDLGLDSLTIAEMLLWLDREFGAHDVDLGELQTVGALVRAAAGQLSSGTQRPTFEVPRAWHTTTADTLDPSLHSATTIPEAFLGGSSLRGAAVAVGDDRSGVLTWTQLRTATLLLARSIADLPGTHVGMLFPASVAGSLTAMAAMIAGKIPVFLNWTAGKRSLEHACEATNLSAILTARSFLDIVPSDLEYLEDRFICLEDLKRSFTLRDKFAARRLAQESTSQIMLAFGMQELSTNDVAAVLFTSGSEALPKGVPLTHGNILANVAGALDAFKLSKSDVLLGFLPPFHSFGLTICTVLPLVTGLRVAYYPNPNESRRIAAAIKRWGATIAAGTPTFLRSMLRAGEPTLFASLRTLVSGAERAPQDLFDLILSYELPVQILEGYGITECAPVVSVNRPAEPRRGVGKPLAGVSVAIVDPNTFTAVPDGTQGLILIHGQNVFSGYLDTQLDPFVEFAGRRWYNSGDLGMIVEGDLIITGRLKRFIKIGGEMVSLSAVEEAITPHLPSIDGTPQLAVLSKGTEGESRPQLILFAVGPITRERANEILHSSGFPHLVHISEVRSVKTIPILGSGKTDYQSLKEHLVPAQHESEALTQMP